MKKIDFEKLVTCKLSNRDPIPFELLILADEIMDAIEKYIYKSELYLIHEPQKMNPIGVVALQVLNDSEIEIKNLAIRKEYRGVGIGSFVIRKVINIALNRGFKYIIVGTADASKRAIQFYERNGFVRFDIKMNFFIENYPAPIFEDGIILKDMIMMKLRLSEEAIT